MVRLGKFEAGFLLAVAAVCGWAAVEGLSWIVHHVTVVWRP